MQQKSSFFTLNRQEEIKVRKQDEKGAVQMKKGLAAVLLLAAAGLTACSSRGVSENDGAKVSVLEAEKQNSREEDKESGGGEVFAMPGAAGSIQIQLPQGWQCTGFPAVGDDTSYGMYIYPKDTDSGYLNLSYTEGVGVCGTGLKEETRTFGGTDAVIGIYDNHSYWDYVVFQEDNKGLVMTADSVEDWWTEYEDEIIQILETVKFVPAQNGSADHQIYDNTEINSLGLKLYSQRIDEKGARLYFYQSGGNAEGELFYGEDFSLEVLDKDTWRAVPGKADTAFHDIAYKIPRDQAAEFEVNWDLIYGQLSPGEYRLGKTVNNFIETGNYKTYTLYVYFVIL